MGTGRSEPDEGVEGIVETRLYLVEFAFLHSVYGAFENDAPRFSFPDLISACVSLVFDELNANERVLNFARTRITQRNADGRAPCRKESMWESQYELLKALQQSPDNRYPNPQFSLGDFTSACVGLVMADGEAQARILQRARANLGRRTQRKEEARKEGAQS